MYREWRTERQECQNIPGISGGYGHRNYKTTVQTLGFKPATFWSETSILTLLSHIFGHISRVEFHLAI